MDAQQLAMKASYLARKLKLVLTMNSEKALLTVANASVIFGTGQHRSSPLAEKSNAEVDAICAPASDAVEAITIEKAQPMVSDALDKRKWHKRAEGTRYCIIKERRCCIKALLHKERCSPYGQGASQLSHLTDGRS